MHRNLNAAVLRNPSAFGFMRWERIWERNAAQRPRWRGMRRDDLHGRLVMTCRFETREATETATGWLIT